MDVSIIIVSYNTKKILADCLKSIYEHTKDISYEIIVSDNGSIDGSVEMVKADFPQVILVENNANLGFGTANNRGLAIANGKYVFYLNSDTVLLNNAVKMFFDYWENNDTNDTFGVLACNLMDLEGGCAASGGNFPEYWTDVSSLMHKIYGFTKLAILHRLFKRDLPIFKEKSYGESFGPVDFVCGADLFLRNDGRARFDEDFFLFYEETFLQYNLAKEGKLRLLIDGPKIIHLHGASSKISEIDIVRNETRFSSAQCMISKVLYYKKIGVSFFKIAILKFLIVCFWSTPMLIKENKKYMSKLLAV